MFNGLRLQLTLLYALAALGLVAFTGGGMYVMVTRYFRSITDLALQHKMAHEFHALGAPLPAELVPADRDWSLVREDLGILRRPDSVAVPERERAEDEDEDEDSARETDTRDDDARGSATGVPPSLAYDAELAAIFVLPLDPAGRILFDPNPSTVPIAVNHAALQRALVAGSDLRTVSTLSGEPVRLLTYRLTRPDGPAALQLGRVLSDQDRVLGQLTVGLIALGSFSMVLIGSASWWFAGRALRPAQDAWERQQRFIASASHELRTPLTLIRASAEVALRSTSEDNSDQRELLGDVLAESDHMRRLVDDLLILSRLDSGRLALTFSRIDLAPLLSDIQRQVARLGAERGVTVVLEPVNGAVRGDMDRMRQVLLILLDNALRHTPAGGQITLSAAAQGKQFAITVRDTGCGIAPEHLPHIFDRFYRIDAARGSSEGNAGLGLAIARGLVEAMGGTIAAESTVEAGTTIRFSLPAA